jgi:hypothetical protein
MSFRRIISSLGLVLAFACIAPAADVEGVLMDKACSAKAVKEGQKAATMHTRECALMPPCKASGYGVFTSDNRYLTFDSAGNEKAVAALEKTDKKDNLKVEVSGEIDGDTIKVESLRLL